LVFEHTRDLNFKVIGVKSPESLRTIRDVATLVRQSLQINLEVQLTAPDYEEADQEVVESPLIVTTQKSTHQKFQLQKFFYKTPCDDE